MTVMQEILGLFGARGEGAYFGEAVSMTDHALQCAHFAQAAAAPEALLVAALLHDVGHLVVDVPEDLADWTEDGRHEEVGSTWIAGRFPAEVAEPVRLHVPAKRYLCAVDPGYFPALSPASVATLKLQGGPMSPLEVGRFEAERHHEAAVRLRLWDDSAKIPALAVAPLDAYRDLIARLATVR